MIQFKNFPKYLIWMNKPWLGEGDGEPQAPLYEVSNE
jgi:hypothetical protein